MQEGEGNPTSNRLGSGIKVDELLAAITKSGYPLQTIVARTLEELGFYVQEEWTYLDKQTNNERNIDIFASLDFIDEDNNEIPPVIPLIDLLVECKRSDLPYIFFLIEGADLYDIPYCTGLKKEELELSTSHGIHTIEISEALGLSSLPHHQASRTCYIIT